MAQFRPNMLLASRIMMYWSKFQNQPCLVTHITRSCYLLSCYLLIYAIFRYITYRGFPLGFPIASSYLSVTHALYLACHYCQMATLARVVACERYSPNCRTHSGCSSIAKAISLRSVMLIKKARQQMIATKARVIGLRGFIVSQTQERSLRLIDFEYQTCNIGQGTKTLYEKETRGSSWGL